MKNFNDILLLGIKEYIEFVLKQKYEEYFGIELDEDEKIMLFKKQQGLDIPNKELYDFLYLQVIKTDKYNIHLKEFIPYFDKCIDILSNNRGDDPHNVLIVNVLKIFKDRVISLLNINDVYSMAPILRSIYEMYLKFNFVYIKSLDEIDRTNQNYSDLVCFKANMWCISSLKNRQNLEYGDFHKEHSDENKSLNTIIDEVKKTTIYKDIVTIYSKKYIKDGNPDYEKINNIIFNKDNSNLAGDGRIYKYSELPSLTSLGTHFNDKYNLLSQISHPTYEPIYRYDNYDIDDWRVICLFTTILIISVFFKDIRSIYGIPVFNDHGYIDYYIKYAEYLEPNKTLNKLKNSKKELKVKILHKDKLLNNIHFMSNPKNTEKILIMNDERHEQVIELKKINSDIFLIKKSIK